MARTTILAWVLVGAGCPSPGVPVGEAPAPAPEPDLIVGDVTIDANPNSAISCVVRWTTDQASTSAVEVGDGAGDYRFRLRDEALVTEHRVVVIGMHASATFHLRAVSVTADGREAASDDLEFTTGPLPPEVHDATVIIPDQGQAEPGWTLTFFGVGSPWTSAPASAVMYDMQGRAVWYRVHPTGPVGLASLVDQGTRVLIASGNTVREVDLAGNVVWTSPNEPEDPAITWFTFAHGSFHHEFRKLPNGNYAVLRYIPNNVGSVTDLLEEMTPEGDVAWSRSALDLSTQLTWTYGTALSIDFERNIAFYASKNNNALYAIDRSTGAILWTLGDGGSFAPDPDATHPWFEAPHAPTMLPGNRILVYDDGSDARPFSRAVEYELDMEAMAARIVWEYGSDSGPDMWRTLGGGTAERQPGGNTLLTAVIGTIGDFGPSRIFEVTAQGAAAWRIDLPASALIYRAERIAPPGIEIITRP